MRMMDPEENSKKEEENKLTWRVHPFTESVKTSVIVIGIVVLICGIVYISFGEVFWVVLAFVFLFVS